MFDSIINSAAEKFGLGEKAGALVSALLALMTDGDGGGFAGFLDHFRQAGLGDLADSWVASGANTPISYEQTESVFGNETLEEISKQVGVDYKTTTSATAYLVPHLVDDLTPNGEVPNESDLLSRIGGYLTGIGASGSSGAAGMADAAFDRVDASIGSTVDAVTSPVGRGIDAVGDPAGAVSGRVSGEMNEVRDNVEDDGASMLKWLLPLLLLGLLVVLGFWFCGRSGTPTAPVGNVNANRTNANANTNFNTTAKTVDSSFKIEAKDGKYTVSGVVPDQATLDKIKASLTARFGAGNVDFSGLKVDANAKPFAANWWTNFEQMLPNLKDWKNGTLSFAGNAVTTASGLPQAALDQIKSLFSGWTLPASFGGIATGTERKLTEVPLPNGTKLQAYPGGIEDQLIKFIQSDAYQNAAADSLNDKWFNFDDLNFKFGTTELVPESKRQLDNIVAILKAFPDVKIKIGGYTDKKGDDAANKKLSDDRAKAVKTALEKAGVGPQVPEAEGYGEEFAAVAETASDEERKADRKTSVRLLK